MKMLKGKSWILGLKICKSTEKIKGAEGTNCTMSLKHTICRNMAHKWGIKVTSHCM